jgi:DASS family divalent anion:Na+ symporter
MSAAGGPRTAVARASPVPSLAAIALLPPLLYHVIRPEVTATPEAPAAARAALAALGPLHRHERIVAVTFAGMVALWALSATLGLDSTARFSDWACCSPPAC